MSASTLQDFEAGRAPLWVAPYRRQHTSRRHGSVAHPFAVLILVTRGESRVRHGAELTLRTGDLHLIPPGDAHGGGHHEEAEGWMLAFRHEALPSQDGWSSAPKVRVGAFDRVRAGCHPVLRPSAAQRRRIEGWLRAMADELAEPRPGRDEALASLLSLVLIEVERIDAPISVEAGPAQSLSRQVLAYIDQHGFERLSLSEVAAAVKRTPSHVASVVRRETGRTVGDWILERRMAEARRRLRGTDERVDVIAERLGYADPTHFIRLFRRVHGVTPAAWRKGAAATASTEA